MIVSIFAPWMIPDGDRKGQRVPGVRPVRWETSWNEFVEVLRTSASLPTPRDHKVVPNVRVNAIGMADYPSGVSRSKGAALGANWIGLDIDDKDGDPGAWKFDALVEYLDHAGVAYALYTTTSCTRERHCLRLVLPFDRHVFSDEWSLVWASFAGWIGQIDAPTKDLSRILYEPRAWEGAYNRFTASPSGRPFVCVDEVVASYAPPRLPEARIPDARMTTPIEAGRWGDNNLTDLESSPIVKPEMVQDALVAPTGGRMYRFLTRVALSAQAQRIAIDEGELTEIGLALARQMFRKDISDVRRDARRALEWAAGVTLDVSCERRLPTPWPWSKS